MNQKYFDLAFEEARKAYDLNEVPVGAVIVKDGKVISKAYNQKESMNCCVGHAEILAIQEASSVLNNWRLEDCEIYVTLDPCAMCASAIKQARIKRVYSALSNSNKTNDEILQKIFQKDQTNPEVFFQSNCDTKQSKKLLNSFFEKQRNA